MLTGFELYPRWVPLKCLNSRGPKYIADFLNLRDVCYNLSPVREVTWYSLIVQLSGCINPFQ